MKNPDLIIFSKQPVPGKTKTRLQEKCGEHKAAEISEFLIRSTVMLVTQYWPGEVFLYGWPNSNHPLFKSLATEFHITLADQGEGDLGFKMKQAFESHIDRQGAAAIMGIDIPHCSGDTIERAYELLADDENVIGPTDDGGYYFMGLSKKSEMLFSGIDWGTQSVLQKTMERAKQDNIEFEMLPMLKDIDTWDDLWIVSQIFEPLRQFIDETVSQGSG